MAVKKLRVISGGEEANSLPARAWRQQFQRHSLYTAPFAHGKHPGTVQDRRENSLAAGLSQPLPWCLHGQEQLLRVAGSSCPSVQYGHTAWGHLASPSTSLCREEDVFVLRETTTDPIMLFQRDS